MIHPTELRVINLIAKNPNRKWCFMFGDDVSYSQYKYWAKKLVSEGLAKEIHHGNNRYNSWVGYVMLKSVPSQNRNRQEKRPAEQENEK